MRNFLFAVLLIGFGVYKGVEWLQSEAYTAFLLKNKEKPWSSAALLKTARYYIFADDWRRASLFLDHCLSEDFKDRPERADCFYEKARAHDSFNEMSKALELYEGFIKEYPGHPKVELAKKRAHLIRYGH